MSISLREMFPDARYVFCVRHPWHTIQSMVIKGNTSFLLRTADSAQLPNDLLLRAAISWAASCEAYRRHADERWTVVRYEDLMTAPDTTVAGLFGFLDLAGGHYLTRACRLPRASDKNYYFVRRAFRRSAYRTEILGHLAAGSEAFGYSIDIDELHSAALAWFASRLRFELGRR